MSEDIRITGQESFRALARRLKAQGEQGRGLKRELNKAFDRAAKPLMEEVKRAEQSVLPHRGGYADLVSSSPITVSKTVRGIRLKQRGKSVKNLTGEDKGILRHPVFGNRKVWVAQKVTGGSWTDTLSSSGTVRVVRDEMLKAMAETAKKIEG